MRASPTSPRCEWRRTLETSTCTLSVCCGARRCSPPRCSARPSRWPPTTRAEGSGLDGEGLPLPHRRGPAGAAPALHDDRLARGRAGARPARHGRLGHRHADAGLRAASCSAPASRSTRASTSSSCPTRSAHGKSSKPSDGLRAKFPRYNYDDMVHAQYRLVTEGLGVKHLRLVLGNSMGGMQAWLWAEQHPDFMDALVPMACQPSEMSGRNWMMRRMLDRRHPQRSRLEGRRLHDAAARRARRQRLLGHRLDRRLAGVLQGGADAREGRQARRRAPGRAVHRRRQRLSLPVGVVGRLQPGARARTDPAPRCSRSTRPTTSAIRPSSASWNAS